MKTKYQALGLASAYTEWGFGTKTRSEVARYIAATLLFSNMDANHALLKEAASYATSLLPDEAFIQEAGDDDGDE